MIDTIDKPFPYTFTDIYRVCLRINNLLPAFTQAGYHVVPRFIYPRECRPGATFQVQAEERFEINLILAGEATVRMTRESVVTPGAVVYQEPGTTCRWRGGEHSCLMVFFWLYIDPPAGLPEPRRWPVWPWAVPDWTLITEESRHNIHGWAERAGWRVSTLFSRLLSRSAHVSKPEKPPSYSHEYLPDVVDTYLTQHFGLRITIDDVAAHAQVSRRTLMREYHRRTGTTIMERLLHLRMNAAVYCLLHTNLALADVAVQSGIPDTNYFNRVFRRHFGMPPLVYRKMHREVSEP